MNLHPQVEQVSHLFYGQVYQMSDSRLVLFIIEYLNI